jgi:protein PhnA
MTEPQCPKCQAEFTYADGNMWVCPSCGHEWSQHQAEAKQQTEVVDDGVIKDSNGNILADGDSVTVIKELKIKGSTSSVKVGTKVKNIRLVDGHDSHNIACKIDGIGAINLKSEFVRKA